ncbi:MAG: PEGA domain-containing protein [Bacteroidetes bacterium]|nr:PEGA domain-containing protein [Bacteroidota bacterium]
MKSLLLLFTLFLPDLLFSQSLREFDLQEMAEQQIPVFVDHPNEAALVIYTAITGFTIESNTGGISKIQNEATKSTIFLKPERQILTLKAPGFIEKKLAMENLSAKQAKFYRLNPKEEKYSSEKGSFKVNTVPDGVMLKIDGIPSFREVTPFELKDFKAGKYQINLTKPDYHPLDTLLEIRPGMKQSGLFRLRSMFGTLLIKAPLTVLVLINDLPVETGSEFVSQKLPEGNYTLAVNDSRFEPFSETIRLGSGDNKVVELPLKKRSGFLRINHPDAFEVDINGSIWNKKKGPQTFEFFEGSFTARVKRTGFKSETFSFSVKKGDVINWEPVFEPVLVQFSLSTIPEGASVTVLQDGEEKVLGFTPFEDQLPVGQTEIMLKKEGFKSYQFQADLTENGNFIQVIDLLNPAKTGLYFDIDGNVYKTILIGNQEWLAENLRVTRYSDGTSIEKVNETTGLDNITNGVLTHYENNSKIGQTYGYLYNWFAVADGKIVSGKSGWRVPTDEDWAKLTDFIGGQSDADSKLKSKSGWQENGNGSDHFGLNLLPGGGCFGTIGTFGYLGFRGFWWTSTSNDTGAWSRDVSETDQSIKRNSNKKTSLLSVRLVRDR